MTLENPTLIIQTKLNRPQVPGDLVPRPRLIERLDQGRLRPLIVVTAPAGYGKSTLLSSWLETLPDELTAWLSLEAYDDDPATFWIYFLSAIQTRFPMVGQNTLAMLNQIETPPPRVLLATLINELNVIREDFILVLDDYHVIQHPGIQQLMAEFLSHIPATCHIVLASRRDPRLPLPKFRARNQVTEIRAGDLRFSEAEANSFFRKSLNRSVHDNTLASIYKISEGWVTGLHLAALSMRRLEEWSQVDDILEREDQFVSDYIMAEVLLDQPDVIQEWLVKTAVLDRFCPELCDALLEDAPARPDYDGAQFIKYLLTHNLFIISLDQQQTWYRYHHLFSHFLKKVLGQRFRPANIAALHSKASLWLAQNHLPEEGLHHALAAGDGTTAAQIVEQNARSLLDEDRWHTLENWLALLPESAIQQSAELLLAKAWEAFHQLALWIIPPLLESIEKLLADDDEAHRALWGEVDFFWGHHWYWQGAQQRSLARLNQALAKIPTTHYLARGEAELFWGLAMQMSGRKIEAMQQLHKWLYYEQESHPGRQTKLMGSLIFTQLLSGELAGAAIMAQQAHELAQKLNNTYVRVWASYLLGYNYYCRNDLQNALSHFNEAVENRYVLHNAAAIDSMAGLALAYQELNQPENAAGITSDMQEFAWETKNPAYVTIARSCQARLALLQGDVIKARRHLQSADLTADAGIMFFWLETPRLTQCRLLIAAGTPTSLAEADQKLEVFRQAEKNNHNSLKMIEILLLQTLSYHKQARIEEAIPNLGAAVRLAHISGISRPFIEAGPELLELLPQLAPQDATALFIETVRKEISIHHPPSALPIDGDEAAVSFAEDLTYREREVLALLADEMSNQEIAAELTISTNTVKRHTGALYRKLDVKNRRQAVTKARHFGLLPTN